MPSKFITNLSKDIANTAIYHPTGKYGKNEFDYFDTRDKKLEKLLSAQPSTADEVNDYLLYVQSLNCADNEVVYKKIETLLEFSKFPDTEISPALKVYKKIKDRLKLYKIITSSIWILDAILVIWCTFSEGLDWAIGFFIVGNIIYTPIAYVAYRIVKKKLGFKDDHPFK